MKIDELAQRAGTTSRNIRAYQERGLLPPVRVEGRRRLLEAQDFGPSVLVNPDGAHGERS
jgi:DNA-binding transcriptional MerR regulator